ncbi:putative efflux pump membrane fusion protein [compost metagenome]
MKRSRVVLIILVVVVLLVGFVIKRRFFPSTFYYAGTIEVTKVDVPARLASVIQSIAIDEGMPVEKDQSLIKLSCEELQVAYDLSQKSYSRTTKLLRGDGVSQEVYDQSKAKKDDLEVRYSWCDIKSPLKGIVLTKYHEVGEMVGPGVKLLTIGDIDRPYAYFYLPHDRLASLKLRQNVKAYLPEMDQKTFEGVIEYIDPEAEFTPKNVQTRDERTRLVFGVKVRFQNSENILKPGMTLEWADED